MKVQVEDVSSIEKRLSIEVEPAYVEKELTQAYAQLSRQVKVPGFRPGKIPRRILEQKFKSEVEADVIKRVQIRAYVDAVKEHNVAAVGDPPLTGGTIDAQKPFAFTARVEVKPIVDAEGLQGRDAPKFDTAVTDERVNEQLESHARVQRTTVEPVEGRDVAQQGDLVVIDFDATVGRQALPRQHTAATSRSRSPRASSSRATCRSSRARRSATRRSFDYTFPADYRVEEMKGQTAHFEARVKELQAKKVPAARRRLRQGVGEENRRGAQGPHPPRSSSAAAKNRRRQVDERDALFQALIEKNAFEVPQAMVERGIDFMLESAFGQMQRQGIDPQHATSTGASCAKSCARRRCTRCAGSCCSRR